jgi:hypothetical protein
MWALPGPSEQLVRLRHSRATLISLRERISQCLCALAQGRFDERITRKSRSLLYGYSIHAEQPTGANRCLIGAADSIGEGGHLLKSSGRR